MFLFYCIYSMIITYKYHKSTGIWKFVSIFLFSFFLKIFLQPLNQIDLMLKPEAVDQNRNKQHDHDYKKADYCLSYDTGPQLGKTLADYGGSLAGIFPGLYLFNSVNCRQTGAGKGYCKIIQNRVKDCPPILDNPFFKEDVSFGIFLLLLHHKRFFILKLIAAID